MAAFFDRLTPELMDFIGEQFLFFVASACPTGRINLSPKGMDTFRVIDANTTAYLDLTGSGNETSAHLGHDGRITVMFCSFTEKPLILRLYGQGRVIRPADTAWTDYVAHFPQLAGTRQVIEIAIESVQTSCGFGVPVFAPGEERPTLVQWAEKRGDEGMTAYRQAKNRVSIDGLDTGLLE